VHRRHRFAHTRRDAVAVPTHKGHSRTQVERGGKMVPFAGYELPVQYAGAGVLKEHMHCRAPGKASVFDVGHMGQIKWTGADRAAFLEKCVVGDIKGLGAGEGRLSLLTNESGGILDDTVITNAGDYIYMVVNGACKVTDMAHLEKMMAENSDMDVQMNYLGDDATLVALQGDGAKTALQPLLPDGFDMERFAFMTGVDTTVGGMECRVTRCGYTGEDGFEIGVTHTKDAVAVAELLLSNENVEPCGLGARDSLRLEAGLCLYGNDLDDTVNPVEGTLLWTIGPKDTRRRTEQGFPGASNMLTAEGKPKKFGRKRVGFMGHTKPARPGADIYSADGTTKVGTVTSCTVLESNRRGASPPAAVRHPRLHHGQHAIDATPARRRGGRFSGRATWPTRPRSRREMDLRAHDSPVDSRTGPARSPLA